MAESASEGYTPDLTPPSSSRSRAAAESVRNEGFLEIRVSNGEWLPCYVVLDDQLRAYNDDRDFREGRQELLVVDPERARVEARSEDDDEHILHVESKDESLDILFHDRMTMMLWKAAMSGSESETQTFQSNGKIQGHLMIKSQKFFKTRWDK
ncbi:hypothetical protein GUITHDRAFT_99548 [Guillardia theta CCMP2712]|uniref:PH domain-containing protein n=1 Tax=Guillardia theta (strain CCMP2712) TaxID=905079 RepID=L1K3G2_GUITC|nr:hypothetical protein GUITHDRAFT_99548 [Guillardia theta CCMP2712]EKX54898.1 hypothetical protein GUITHDRAFT_99548 [Guillardia theta CCMP2712]|eukprot:XP_005841878.1 hypothetical protein GUITHDRAFT_99548 [Guillardia theta CCMP2712]